ncbi:hypothetical protein Tco_0659758 [Tanacetum coccineum]
MYSGSAMKLFFALLYSPGILLEISLCQQAPFRRRKPLTRRLREGVSLEVGGEDCGFDSNEEEVVPKVDDVSLVDRVFDGAFGGEGEEDVVMGEGVVVISSPQEMLINSCLGGIMVSLIFLEGLEEEA